MKRFIIIVLTINLCSSCVSKKIYTDLEEKYTYLKKESKRLTKDLKDVSEDNSTLTNTVKKLQNTYDDLIRERDHLQLALETSRTNYNNLKASCEALEKNSSSEIAKNSKKNRELLAQLDAKEQALINENKRLNMLKKELDSRSSRIIELETVIAAKDASMHALKDAISKALTNFEGKGLTVDQRGGKVYISMENKLLFKSGSWSVGSNGRKAVEQLANVLAKNPDIAILIEGHTDNDPFKGNGQISGNWDLSTKRATVIVNILEEYSGINPENLTAAGRGQYAPVAPNSSASGKAKNRRIEIILTPKLDEISKLLNDI